jgi:hypothetical protein
MNGMVGTGVLIQNVVAYLSRGDSMLSHRIVLPCMMGVSARGMYCEARV